MGGHIEVVTYYGSVGSDLLDEYCRICGSGTPTSGMRCFLALDSDRPVGIIGFTENRIKLFYTADSAPEETGRDLLKAVIADAVNRGASSIYIHSLDLDGKGDRTCRELGFTDDGACPCSQGTGTICLKKTF